MDNIVKTAALGAAAVVGAQYLDAKLDIANDVKLIKATVLSKLRCVWGIFGCGVVIVGRRRCWPRIAVISSMLLRTLHWQLRIGVVCITRERSGLIRKSNSSPSNGEITFFLRE